MLKRFFELRGEVAEFMEKKGHPVGELKCKEWVQDLAFIVDITQHLNTLNTTLQGRNKVVTQNEDSIRAWEAQLYNSDTGHFPCLTAVRPKAGDRIDGDMNKYKGSITDLLHNITVNTKLCGTIVNRN